ncbi:MAG: SPOR domain-containing protein, partial [Bacteroidales bacterium]|nr:SPOR domain-containing protein [Bacteroidales bacterium]
VCFSPDGLPRFYAGVFATRDEAVRYRDELVSRGYSDAWTPLLDENRCNDFDLYYLLNLDKKSSSQERSEVFYTVQIGAGNMKISYFNKLKNIRLCEGDDGLTRFIVGEFSSKDEALRVRDEIVKLGYTDAWIPEIDAKRCGN